MSLFTIFSCNVFLERSRSIFIEWRIAHYHEIHFFYLSSHLIVNDFCYFCVSIRGNFFRGLFPLNTPPLTPKNYFSNFCFLEFDSQSYNKHSQNFVIRNMQTKFACSLKFVSLLLTVFFIL